MALTVAAETLDVSELNRQVRALELLGEESRKALFFAASRRLMLDLMRGRTDTVAPLVGIREVVAEIAWIYLEVGLPDEARRLASTFDERVLSRLPRDHDYLLTLQLLLDVALATGLEETVETITPLLMPYAGRAVINAGAVMFHGVTDDTLARACARLGDAERATALREKALATYRRIGATWWRERLEAAPAIRTHELSTAMTLRPGPAGVWFVGRGSEESAIPARRGFEHLHALLTQPGTEVPALRLAGGVETVEQAGLGEVADAQAFRAYRRRLAEIDTELDAIHRADPVVAVHQIDIPTIATVPALPSAWAGTYL